MMIRVLGLPALLFSVATVGCAPEASTSARPTPSSALLASAPASSAPASSRWNAIAQQVVARREMGPLGIARTLAMVSVAQYDAVVAAQREGTGDDVDAVGAPAGRRVKPDEAAAAAAASAAVLTGIYPMEAVTMSAALATDRSAFAARRDDRTNFAAGEGLGTSVAQAVLARGATDGSTAVWTGTAPTGAGIWFSAPLPARPLSPLWGEVRPWLMTSGDEFRPAAPPAPGSPAFVAALAEVRHYSDTRTPAQLAIAQYWGNVVMTSGPAGLWSDIGLALAAKRHFDERKTARMLALMHMAGMDASIGCWDAKYAYWLLRPFQADPAITTPVGRPNFPSFPSAHSCLSSAYAGVLAGLFPDAARDLAAKVDEAGVSRIYAGLHYRFDVTAGQDIGAAVAGLALRAAPEGNRAIPLD